MMRLKDKVAIITGSSLGIGQAAAYKFVEEGAKVVVLGLEQGEIDETLNVIKDKGGEALGFKVNVTEKEQVESMVKEVKDKWGKIDVLVNNAGIIADAQLAKMTDEQWDRVIDVNLKGTYICTKAVVDTMVEQNSGVIINVSSVVGLYGNFGQTNYAASKWGVIGMSKTWAKELGRKNIRSNVVCPGFIRTSILDTMPDKIIKAMEDKVPMKRLGKPEEVANVFAFLASDEASYMNGSVIEVSGGVVL